MNLRRNFVCIRKKKIAADTVMNMSITIAENAGADMTTTKKKE